MMSKELSLEITTADICERLVGVRPVDLQNFLMRGSFGLRSSVSPGKVRSKRRLFSREDVYGIALVWLLVETGLRSEVVDRILSKLGGETKKPDANRAAKKLQRTQGDVLLIVRSARKPSKSAPLEAELELAFAEYDGLENRLSALSGNVVVISFRSKFDDVRKRLELLFPE